MMLACALRTLREQAGISPERASEAIQVTVTGIGALERGRRPWAQARQGLPHCRTCRSRIEWRARTGLPTSGKPQAGTARKEFPRFQARN
jgi:DNA-binding XRE family transcriptional regulator